MGRNRSCWNKYNTNARSLRGTFTLAASQNGIAVRRRYGKRTVATSWVTYDMPPV